MTEIRRKRGITIIRFGFLVIRLSKVNRYRYNDLRKAVRDNRLTPSRVFALMREESLK